MPAPIVFFDIAGPDSKVLKEFYSTLFGWPIANDGKFTTEVLSPLEATIRQDPAEKRVYIGVEDVAAKLQEIEAHGGSVDVPRFEVPGVVVLGLFRDPAGNPLGLVELEGGRARIP
jgi:predicted enzyme related to lactoylglutathione lyase